MNTYSSSTLQVSAKAHSKSCVGNSTVARLCGGILLAVLLVNGGFCHAGEFFQLKIYGQHPCCEPDSSVAALLADGNISGTSVATASVFGNAGYPGEAFITSVTWSFLDDPGSRGCSIKANGSEEDCCDATITPGRENGRVIVKATVNYTWQSPPVSGTEEITAPLDLCGGENGCTVCDGQFGSANGDNADGPNIQWALGADGPESRAGFLKLNAVQIAEPSQLQLPYGDAQNYGPANVVVSYNNGEIQLIQVPDGLIQVVNDDDDEDDKKYQLKFKDENGDTISTWRIMNPSGEVSQLRIIEYEGDNVDISAKELQKFDYVLANGVWTLTQGANLRSVTSHTTTETTGGRSFTHKYREIKSGSQTVSKTHWKYETVTIDTVPVELLIEVTEGDGQATRTTTYTYYDTGVSAGKVRHYDVLSGSRGCSFGLARRVRYA